MKIDKKKLEIAMANAGASSVNITSVCRATYCRAMRGENLMPKTVGKLAKELGVSVTDIVEAEVRR